jgi:hypothetical protein
LWRERRSRQGGSESGSEVEPGAVAGRAYRPPNGR